MTGLAVLACLALTACATPNPPLPATDPVRPLAVLTCEAQRQYHPIRYALGHWRASCGR